METNAGFLSQKEKNDAIGRSAISEMQTIMQDS
jgi:hypothetical protein